MYGTNNLNCHLGRMDAQLKPCELCGKIGVSLTIGAIGNDS